MLHGVERLIYAIFVKKSARVVAHCALLNLTKTLFMLTEKQTLIADLLLKHLLSNDGRTSDIKLIQLFNADFDKREVNFVTAFLTDELNLIEYWEILDPELPILLTRLKRNGYKAAKIGITEYLKKIDEEEQLKIDSTILAMKKAKNAEILSIVAIVVTVGIFIFDKLYPLFYK